MASASLFHGDTHSYFQLYWNSKNLPRWRRRKAQNLMLFFSALAPGDLPSTVPVTEIQCKAH